MQPRKINNGRLSEHYYAKARLATNVAHVIDMDKYAYCQTM